VNNILKYSYYVIENISFLIRFTVLKMASMFWHVELGGLAGLMFDPEDGRSMFLRNAGKLLPDHTASQPRS
jgi:hypothetical protein